MFITLKYKLIRDIHVIQLIYIYIYMYVCVFIIPPLNHVSSYLNKLKWMNFFQLYNYRLLFIEGGL